MANRRAFSLIELVIVIVIVAIIAAIAAPRLSDAASRSAMQSTHASFLAIEKALQLYYSKNGEWPPNSNTGQQPVELNSYLSGSPFSRMTPMGGNWDWNGPGSSVTAYGYNISIRNLTTARRAQFDQLFDDGNANTGAYRNDGAYLVRPISPP